MISSSRVQNGALSVRSRRTTCRLHASPVSRTVRTTLNPAFSKARKDLRLLSSGSLTTARTSGFEKTTCLTNSRIAAGPKPKPVMPISLSPGRCQPKPVPRPIGPHAPDSRTRGTIESNLSAFLLDHEHVRRLSAIHTRTVFRLNPRQIESLIPPGRDVRGRKPFSKKRKVGSSERSE